MKPYFATSPLLLSGLTRSLLVGLLLRASAH